MYQYVPICPHCPVKTKARIMEVTDQTDSPDCFRVDWLLSAIYRDFCIICFSLSRGEFAADICISLYETMQSKHH